ncbi:hypothetical protein [Microbacterium hydrocarbonoxydans]|uniref:hypothetical protein n=1 Tax=Microbacterium hydrocarbonoxydans TaxID=273678 RepID=UPI00203DDC5F|nr:hypothetical protein [Microbacterium hydrocarbonoxydans]MCM3780651.1 hypothetical protein [Microbacterium hydrocarbonoxydans]
MIAIPLIETSMPIVADASRCLVVELVAHTVERDEYRAVSQRIREKHVAELPRRRAVKAVVVASESDSSSRSRFALSLSADGESTPTIPSGKYEGRSAAGVLAQDPQYVEWILAQPRVHDRSPQLAQFFSRGEDTDSMRVAHRGGDFLMSEYEDHRNMKLAMTISATPTIEGILSVTSMNILKPAVRTAATRRVPQYLLELFIRRVLR